MPAGAELHNSLYGAWSQVQVSPDAELHTTGVYVVREAKIRCQLAQNFIILYIVRVARIRCHMAQNFLLHTSVVYVVREAKFRCHPAQNFILQLCMWCVKPTSCAIWPKLFVLHSSDTYVLCNSKTWCYLEQTRCFELQKFYWSNTSYISCHVIDSLKRWRRPIGCSNIWHKSGASEVNTRNSLSNRCSQP